MHKKTKTTGLAGRSGSKTHHSKYFAYRTPLGSMEQYEQLKCALTLRVSSSTEYEAACRMAAELAGV